MQKALKALAIIFVAAISIAICSTAAYSQKTINNEADAQAVYAQAKAFVARYKMSVPRDVILRLETEAQIQSDFSRHGRSGANVEAYYQPYGPECICIPEGLSETEFFATAVHELTHAWQSSACPMQDRSFKEGLSSWMTAQAYQSRGRVDLAINYLNYISRTDAVENQTVNKLNMIFRSKGIDEVIKYVTSNSKYTE